MLGNICHQRMNAPFKGWGMHADTHPENDDDDDDSLKARDMYHPNSDPTQGCHECFIVRGRGMCL